MGLVHSFLRQACAPVSLGAEALSAALDEGSLAALLHPVSFAKTKVRKSENSIVRCLILGSRVMLSLAMSHFCFSCCLCLSRSCSYKSADVWICGGALFVD